MMNPYSEIVRLYLNGRWRSRRSFEELKLVANVIFVFAVNYSDAIDVKVGDGYYPFDPISVDTHYDEPVVFIRTGTKTFALDEYDDCTKSERPDSFHAVLTNEQPKAIFMPKNTTGRTEFHIRTNGPGCESQDQIVISASEDLQGGLKIIQKYNTTVAVIITAVITTAVVTTVMTIVIASFALQPIAPAIRFKYPPLLVIVAE
ncbi:hypothetical protein GLOIN_2v1847391 [Rhizophagus irregularis DAOM 181602=DAOM 197198]|nr:hypothetical protein GLOIN_2v1847391 [Rhizophagus irregularis DAOM 181602=DAOM 197198]